MLLSNLRFDLMIVDYNDKNNGKFVLTDGEKQPPHRHPHDPRAENP